MHVASKRSANSGRSGRGPMSDMSPRRTLNNWGSSSKEVARRNVPKPVRRSGRPRPRRGPCPARVEPGCEAAAGGSSRIERSLSMSNSWPSMPTRRCRKRIGRPSVISGRRPPTSSSGEVSSIASAANDPVGRVLDRVNAAARDRGTAGRSAGCRRGGRAASGRARPRKGAGPSRRRLPSSWQRRTSASSRSWPASEKVTIDVSDVATREPLLELHRRTCRSGLLAGESRRADDREIEVARHPSAAALRRRRPPAAGRTRAVDAAAPRLGWPTWPAPTISVRVASQPEPSRSHLDQLGPTAAGDQVGGAEEPTRGPAARR